VLLKRLTYKVHYVVDLVKRSNGYLNIPVAKMSYSCNGSSASRVAIYSVPGFAVVYIKSDVPQRRMGIISSPWLIWGEEGLSMVGFLGEMEAVPRRGGPRPG
jgi:hypothetical protein